MEETSQHNIKVALVGPESSGKSTLAKELSIYFNGHYVEEFARRYLEENGANYVIEDLDFFAESQLNSEKTVAENQLLFCDTTPLSIKVWSIYKYGKYSNKVDLLTSSSHYDLNLLLKPDLSYEFDPLREDSPQKNREELFELFKKELEEKGANYSIIEGIGNIRLNNAIEVIKSQFSF